MDHATRPVPPIHEAVEIQTAFLEKVGTGPVFVSANMADPSHAGTNMPLVRFSPLIRIAIAATEMGATTLIFDRAEIQPCVAAVIKELGVSAVPTPRPGVGAHPSPGSSVGTRAARTSLETEAKP